jgi:hypothetical protein
MARRAIRTARGFGGMAARREADVEPLPRIIDFDGIPRGPNGAFAASGNRRSSSV